MTYKSSSDELRLKLRRTTSLDGLKEKGRALRGGGEESF